MGSVFGFVSSDVKTKIEILESLRQQEDQNQFESFAAMLEYEKSAGLLNKKDYVSGSRTLLRLHRGLGTPFYASPVRFNWHFDLGSRFVTIFSLHS